jgi:hypothetical protein
MVKAKEPIPGILVATTSERATSTAMFNAETNGPGGTLVAAGLFTQPLIPAKTDLFECLIAVFRHATGFSFQPIFMLHAKTAHKESEPFVHLVRTRDHAMSILRFVFREVMNHRHKLVVIECTSR